MPFTRSKRLADAHVQAFDRNLSLPCLLLRRYDEFGRRKRSKQADEDKRAREAAALQRLYGGTNMAPSEQVSNVRTLGRAAVFAGAVTLHAHFSSHPAVCTTPVSYCVVVQAANCFMFESFTLRIIHPALTLHPLWLLRTAAATGARFCWCTSRGERGWQGQGAQPTPRQQRT